MILNWKVSKQDHKLIVAIVARAAALADRHASLYNASSGVMDLTAVHANGNRLRLNLTLSWLGAADYQMGSPATGLGWNAMPAAQFTANVHQR